MEEYEIVIRGWFSERWVQGDVTSEVARLPTGETVICVAVPDQSALYGILTKVRDMNVTLIRVSRRGNPEAGS